MLLEKNSKGVESATIESLYTALNAKLAKVAKKQIDRRALGHLEAFDLVNEAFAFGFVERWIASFDIESTPAHIKVKKPVTLDVAELPDEWTAAQISQYITRLDAVSSSEPQDYYREALEFWIVWKFRYFCGDQMRRKVQNPTLNLDYNRGKEGTGLKVTSVQLEETFDVARHQDPCRDAAEYLEYCSAEEADVLHRMYWLGQTRAFIAQIYNCHPNTISAIRKSAEDKIRESTNDE